MWLWVIYFPSLVLKTLITGSLKSLPARKTVPLIVVLVGGSEGGPEITRGQIQSAHDPDNSEHPPNVPHPQPQVRPPSPHLQGRASPEPGCKDGGIPGPTPASLYSSLLYPPNPISCLADLRCSSKKEGRHNSFPAPSLSQLTWCNWLSAKHFALHSLQCVKILQAPALLPGTWRQLPNPLVRPSLVGGKEAAL